LFSLLKVGRPPKWEAALFFSDLIPGDLVGDLIPGDRIPGTLISYPP